MNINQLDTQAFLWLNSQHNESFDKVMAFVSGKNEWIPLYLIIIISIIWKYRQKSIGILLSIIMSVVLSDRICSGVLKPLVARLRPCHEPSIQQFVHVVGDCGGEFGFCSSHAANSFTLATSLFLLFGKQFPQVFYFYLWAIIVSYSRIYVGVHYPLDVLAGAGIGVLSAIVCNFLHKKFSNRTLINN